MDLRGNVLTKILEFAPTVLNAAQGVYKIVQRVRTPFKPWGRPHDWHSFRTNDDGVLERLPYDYCFHCKATRAADNENTKCPGPPGWR